VAGTGVSSRRRLTASAGSKRKGSTARRRS
jgi:hypothetical protein